VPLIFFFFFLLKFWAPLILFYFFNLTPQIVKAGSTPAWSGIS
jgi:hypothetical protein